MKTIKIIDLLNKIANGEELPTEIEYSRKHYYLTNNNDIDAFGSVIGMFSLNDEITILDEDYIVDTPKEDLEKERFKLHQALCERNLTIEDLQKRIDKVLELLEECLKGESNE